MAAPTVTHSKVSGVANPGDGRVGGADWDANHVLSYPQWDDVITKSADEDVSSNTTPQNDDHLFFTTTNNGYYEFEMILIVSSPVGGATPDWKGDFGEDGTFRGYMFTAAAATGSLTYTVVSIQQGQTWAIGTGTQAYPHIIRGGFWAGGGTMRLRWAQNTSSGNATRVHQGSLLRYKRII